MTDHAPGDGARTGRVRGALYGSLLFEQPAHRAVSDDLAAFLAAPGPVALEIGCDTATVLLDHARTFPDVRWVGLEIRKRKVARAAPAAPPNARVLAIDARTALARLIPEGRLSRVDVLFPTPAADPRHVLFTDGLVADLQLALAPAGVLTVATDVPWLWEAITALLAGWRPAEAPPRGEVRSRRERVCRREGLRVFLGSWSPPDAPRDRSRGAP